MLIKEMHPNDEISLAVLSTGIYYVVFFDENNIVNRTKIMTFQ